MDNTKSIRKLRGEYIDWYGRPSTKKAYDAQFVEEAQGKLHEDAVKRLQHYEYPPASDPDQMILVDNKHDFAVVGESTIAALRSVPLASSDLPHRKKFEEFGATTLADIPSSQGMMQDVPGIGPVAAREVAAWFYENWEIEIP